MQSKVKTVSQYIKELPAEKRMVIESVRTELKKYWPKGIEEVMQYGMIAYVVPLTSFQDGYLNNPEVPLPFAGLAAQKNHFALYTMSIYQEPDQLKNLQAEYKKHGMKLDMGKSCIRFKKLEQVNLPAIGKIIKKSSVKKFIELYKKSHKK